jgi:CheY-like chemotaxis protein
MTDALDQVATSRIDAAVVDLLLPDGDGIELTTQLRT